MLMLLRFAIKKQNIPFSSKGGMASLGILLKHTDIGQPFKGIS
jgi:hypothetical protein